MELSNANAIVTGGASGMGRYFCLELAKAGAQVTAFDLSEEGLDELVDAAGDASDRIHTAVADVSDEAQVVEAVAQAEGLMGGLNVLVNNAGIFRDQLLVKQDKATGELRTMSLDTWQSVIDVDLTGPFLCTREFSKRVIGGEHAPAVVINLSSVSRHGNIGQTNYSAAKAGLVADTRVWGKELARHGIRCGAIAPGFIDTPILQGMPQPVLDKLVKGVALRRVGDPHEIWLGVKFIIECDYFTGRCIDIDGGATM